MTDHKTEAEEVLTYISNGADQSDDRNMLIEAQVHATLYLADQQRIGNLMRFAALFCESAEFNKIGASIREGLSL